MLKSLILLGFFLLFTAMLWGLGMNPYMDDKWIKYLIFATQLLYGNMCYDIMKCMRIIPSGDTFWNSVLKITGEAIFLLFIALGLLVLAFKFPFFAYGGLIGSMIAYLLIFYRVLPKLQPTYTQARSSESASKI